MRNAHRKKIFSSSALAVVLVATSLSLVACGSSSKGANPPSPPPVGVGPPPAPPPVPPSPPPPGPPPEPPSPPPQPGPPPPPPPPPPPVSPTTWQKDYYLPRSTYKNRCLFPRTGQQPITNRTFTDVKGTMLDELFYLRSLTRETYLWRDDLTDMDPSDYNQIQSSFGPHVNEMNEYFQKLKTEQPTANGNPKDKFHYIQLTADYIDLVYGKPPPSYGINWVFLSEIRTINGQRILVAPRDMRVRYVEPDSPAAEKVAGVPKVKRGDKVLQVNEADFINGNDDANLNYAFRAPRGRSTTFVLLDAETNQEKTVTLQSKDLDHKPVNQTTILEIDNEKVGYIHYTSFATKTSDSSAHNAIKELKTAGVKDLVFDMRYNGGGFLDVAAMIGYMIAGESNTKDKSFSKQQFHSGAGNLDPVLNIVNTPTPFHSTGQDSPSFSIPDGTKLDSLNLNKVYILTTQRTCSASEALINGLIGADIEVILIGDTTCGKPYGFYSQDNCGITYSTVQLQILNHKNFGAYADGLVPSSANDGAKVKGCKVAEDYSKQLGDRTEPLLAAALKYRKDGKCPAAPSPPSPPSAIGAIASSDGSVGQSLPKPGLVIPDDPKYIDEIIMPREW